MILLMQALSPYLEVRHDDDLLPAQIEPAHLPVLLDQLPADVEQAHRRLVLPLVLQEGDGAEHGDARRAGRELWGLEAVLAKEEVDHQQEEEHEQDVYQEHAWCVFFVLRLMWCDLDNV